ncbi:MAG TPA: chromate efflux transporter [Steroidobacteraceae bacterium]|nr:chromate efflux transporter [Steroidobacteraceae bacterium]
MTPGFATAARFWARLGFVSFGGPAGQIAIMHREIVARRQWIDERTFTGALNFCMLLPGPEALQLAIFLGWKMHGVRGGLVAGLGFILPSVVLLFALATVYVWYGRMPWLDGVLFGLKAAVIALVVQALVRIGRRALAGTLHVVLALGAFVALEFLGVPFPVVLLVAAVAGAVFPRHDTAPARLAPPVRYDGTRAHTVRIAAVGLALWIAPWLWLVPALGMDSLWSQLYLFFTKAALVTFGGAYAVLSYVTAQLVEHLGWVTAEQSVAGLALAESTPGPLVIVLQFMGFVAGWNQPGAFDPLVSALLAGALAAWATFLPSFVFIFMGAPHVERLTHLPRMAAALAAITAAVVGVIATLALLLAQVILFPDGWLEWPDWRAAALSVGAWIALERWRWSLPAVLGLAGALGLLLRWLP